MLDEKNRTRRSRWLSPGTATLSGAVLTAVLSPLVAFWLENRDDSADSAPQPVAGVEESDSSPGGEEEAPIHREPARPDPGRPSASPEFQRAEPPPPPSPRPSDSEARGPRLRTLAEGNPVRLSDPDVSLSVTFSDDLGGMATLRIHPAGGRTITEALLGPGGRIPFRGSSGEHSVSVVDWDPAAKTLSVEIH